MESGEDVTIYFATIHPRERYGDSKLMLTALLNFEPTDVTYEQYDGRHEDVVREISGSRAIFPVDGAIEIFDITISAKAFDGPGRYDIGFGWGSKGPVDFSVGWRRLYVYYGSCVPKEHPCMKPVEPKEINADERRIGEKYFTGANVYPAGKYANRGPFEEIEVNGGEEVSVTYSISSHEFDTSWVVVPFVDGKPADKRHYLYTTTHPDSRVWDVVARRNFKLTIPQEPGTHTVIVALWDTPYLEHREDAPRDIVPAGAIYGSNRLKFVVPE